MMTEDELYAWDGPTILKELAICGLGLAKQGDFTQTTFIYFIRAGISGNIKIGVSQEPESRCSQLQTATHEPLRIVGLARGSYADEQEIHSIFASDRLIGEWFAPSRHLLMFVAKVNSLYIARLGTEAKAKTHHAQALKAETDDLLKRGVLHEESAA